MCHCYVKGAAGDGENAVGSEGEDDDEEEEDDDDDDEKEGNETGEGCSN